MDATLTYEQFRKKYPATRCFQQYDSDTRAMHAASPRLGHRQRARVGEFFYTHPLKPDVGFSTAKEATKQAYAVYLEHMALTHVLAELGE